jgi:hypothetical protein
MDADAGGKERLIVGNSAVINNGLAYQVGQEKVKVREGKVCRPSVQADNTSSLPRGRHGARYNAVGCVSVRPIK